jgi:hypothetical protein
MPHRGLPVFLLLFVCLATQAFADLEIKKARYGNTTAYREVSDILVAYLRNNTLSFPVNARSMGGNPTRGMTDFLFVVYSVNGREYTDTVPEGGIFTFKGLTNVQPVRPPLNLPFLRPSTPLTAPLTVVNRSNSNLRIYSVDRYGRWVWSADMFRGQTLSFNGQVGQEWIAADYTNRAFARQRISRGDNVMMVSEPDTAPPPGGYRGDAARVRFENNGFRSLYLYQVDGRGSWDWMATLEPGGGYSALGRVGEVWIATDTANRIVRQVTVGLGMSRVPLN